ncbi:MAG TPA: ABC transporter ATP-binding protein, partial [Thermoleophilia bacterium]|nr:ABC transporter ATP-binding protein [Thermoleophilia bacterium]
MATSSRHARGPHSTGASLEELRGWRAFVHLARELKLARLARYARPYRRRAILSLLAMVAVTMSGLAVPYLLKVAIDAGIGAGSVTVLTWVIVAFIGVSLVNLGASYLQTYLTSWVGSHVIDDLRRELFAHLQKLSLDFFSRQRTGWIVSRLTNDIDALDQLVTEGVTSLVTNSLTFLGAIVLLFILDWRLALATLTIMPPLLAATLVFRSRSARTYAQVRNRIGDVSAHLQESISGVRVLQTFRREQSDYARLEAANAAYRATNMRTVVQSGVYFPFVEFMSATAVVIVLWYGGSLIDGDALEIGVLVAFIGYLNSFFDPLQQLSQLYNTFQASMAAVQKIYAVLDTEPDMTDAPDAVDMPDVRGDVELRGVTFGYHADQPVLHALDIAIAAGRTVALVGATGAGKSTVIKLLARFYDPDQGAVLIDGHDLRKVTMRSLREQIAVVPQEAFLFSGSVLDNIRFGRPSTDPAEVKRIARIVGVHEFVEALPQGYETEVHEGGAGLSTGQRQLISFARALLADPRVLILDEATSSVDAESERRIERAMEVLFSGRTSVIVAHRLSTVRYADEILVIDGGRVIERG